MYDDQFIETCAEWLAPYIGDLIGYRTLHGVVRATYLGDTLVGGEPRGRLLTRGQD